MISTLDQALAFVRRHRLVSMTRAGVLPCFVEEVAGEPVRGSWWGHPRGKVIFNLSEDLADTGEVLVAKVAHGKVGLVHAALWPALVRIVTDRGWRAAQERGLPAAARDLLARVERLDALRLEAADRKPGKVLEQRLLVLAASVHTDKGSHVTVLRPWSRWASAEVTAAACALDLDEARAALAAAGPPLVMAR